MKNADSQHNLSSIASRHLGAGRALPGIPKTWVACLLALATTIVGSNMACGQNPRGPLDVWTQVNTDIVIGVAGSPNTLVGVGGLGTVVTSTNGVDWSTQVSGVTSDLYTIVYGNGLFVAGGDAGTIITSADGVAWTSPLSNTTNAIYGLAFGNGNEILTSTDGVKWTVRPSTTPWGFSYIAFGSGRFTALAGPESSFLPYLSLVSTNGIDWSAAQRIYNLEDPAFWSSAMVSSSLWEALRILILSGMFQPMASIGKEDITVAPVPPTIAPSFRRLISLIHQRHTAMVSL